MPTALQVQGTMTIDELIDECWDSMRPQFMRRAVLSKPRCARLVMMTLAQFPDRELAGSAAGSAFDRQTKRGLAMDIEKQFRQQSPEPTNTYGAVFLSIVLAWAIKFIIDYLIDQWRKNTFSMDTIRQQYGWN